MDEGDISEDTTCKQQEDLPYDGDLSQIKICSDYNFTSKTDILDISNQIILTGDDPQGKATCNQTCRNTAMAMTLDKNTENAVNKKHDKKKQCPATLHIPANKGDTSKSNISDILLHHLSEEQFLRGQGIDCETLPEDSNADSFDEAAIMKNIISCYVKNSWPKEQTPELIDKLNPKRDGENSNKPCCSSITAEENTSDLEEPVAAGYSSHQENSDFLTKIKSAIDKQKSCQGQAPQKQQTGKACSGIGFKYGQGQVHYQLPDFSKVAPKVKIPKNNVINKPLTITEQASFSPKLRDKSTTMQNILETMSWSNCVEKQQQELKKKITEPSQQIQMEPAGHIHEELLTGIEAETSLFKLSSTFQKDPSSSSSYIFQKIFQGKQMCQKLKEQTDQLTTKVQEFSKRIKQDSLCHLQDRRLVLEKLQGHLELLEQEFLATKEEHLTLQQQVHKHESLTVGDFDPERRVEGEIFKLAMLLEDIKEKIDESKYTSAFSLPMSSPFILHDLAFISSSPSNEMPQEHPGRPPWRRGSCGSEVTGAPRAGPQEAPSSEELRELASQTYLNGQSGNAAAQDQPNQMATRLSSDSREDPSGPAGRQERAGTPAPSPSCAFCRRLLERKQKMEKKDHRRINCGRFSIVTQEKALHLDSPLSSDTGRHFCSDSGAGLQSNKCEDCGARIPNRSKEPLKEFHYRYNTPGQNYVNHSERGAFVQYPSVDESKNSSPACSKPKWICSQSVTSKSFQDECEPTPGKKNLKAFMTYSSDPATPSPHFHSCKISGSKSLHDFDNIKDTKSEILNSALDHALRTATILKETTDQMIKTIAEDLAKARRWRNRLKY